MTDAQISEKLAMAIGWKREDVRANNGNVYCRIITGRWRRFDFRTPGVIWPIAERYGIFPHAIVSGHMRATSPEIKGWECDVWHYKRRTWGHFDEVNVELVVALAVIWSLS